MGDDIPEPAKHTHEEGHQQGLIIFAPVLHEKGARHG
jgi:hypothetical protein